MHNIQCFIDQLLALTGITGAGIPLLRHRLLAAVAVFLSWFSGWLGKRLVIPAVHKLTARTTASWDNMLLNDRVLNTACRIIPAVVIWKLLPWVFFQVHFLHDVLTRLTAIYICVMTAKLFLVLISSFEEMDTMRNSSMQQYAKSFLGVLRIVLIFITAIVVIAILFDKNPLSLIAGLGATSAVLMLVFKDTIEGLVAGIRLNSNEMVHKGDWITVPSTPADGIVEDITLTTVKVRNFDNTTVTVSPVTLVNGSFQNWKSMIEGAGRRVNRVIYFDFRSIRFVDDAQRQALIAQKLFSESQLQGNQINMALYRRYIEQYLASREDVSRDMTIMVRELEATQCGLPIGITFFIKNDPNIFYEHHLADIIEHCYAATALFGLTIYQQYPEQ